MRAFLLQSMVGFLAMTVVISIANAAMEEVLLFDDFDHADGVTVRSTTPPIGPSWTGSPGFSTLDQRLIGQASGSGHLLSSSFGLGYFADNPGIYTISADVFLSTDMNEPDRSWQIGFTETTNSSAGANRSLLSSDGRAGAPGIILRGNGQLTVSVSGSSNALNTAQGEFPAGVEYTLKLILNTMLPNWTVDAFVDDTQLDLNSDDTESMTYTYTTNPTLRYATIAATIRNEEDRDSTYLDNILLTVIPEPTTAVLIGLAGLALLGRSRRRVA